MSILIIGGDEIAPIKAVLGNFGFKKIKHWDSRKNSVNHKNIPKNTDCLLLLTNFLQHNAMKKFKLEAKKLQIPTLFAKRSVSEVYEACIKATSKSTAN